MSIPDSDALTVISSSFDLAIFDMPADAMSAADAVQAYKDPAPVERALRSLRVRAYAFLCMLAYVE
jgi:hypothetical protein